MFSEVIYIRMEVKIQKSGQKDQSLQKSFDMDLQRELRATLLLLAESIIKVPKI